MSTQTIVEITDDLGGTGEATTATFGFNGKQFEIDLNKRNMTVFMERMQKYSEAGREVKTSKAKTVRGDGEAAKVREWAQAAGVPVNARGRVSAELREAYQTAQNALAVAAK